MRGAKELTALRVEGLKPDWLRVFVGEGDYMSGEWYKWRETIKDPCVDIEDDDDIGLIDFRFVVGLEVILTGSNPDRLLAVYEKMTKYNPRRLILFHSNEDQSVEILDNRGILSGILE